MSKTRRVAVMLDLEWPYKRHVGIFAGTQQYAQEHGWESTVDEYADDTLPARRGKPVPYDGVIAQATKKLADRARRLKVPVVNVWVSSPARGLPAVFPDHASIGRMRAEHLLARGFRRFASLGARSDRAHSLEMETFQATVRKKGYPCLASMIPLHFSLTLAHWRKTEAALADWMKDWQVPIGVFVGPDQIGRLVVQMCRSRGWQVPGDVAIITAYNEETICEHPRPSLTSVEIGHERIGYEAAGLLDRLMDGEAAPKEPILLPPEGIIARESTDFFAVDNALVNAALRFIAAHSHRRIRADDVARAVAAETRTLQRRFAEHLGRPIATEIRRSRLERAKRELAGSDRSIAEIALDVGFTEPRRMSEIFHREIGMTPKEYRQRQQRTDIRG